MVRLEQPIISHMNLNGTSLLSFHCQERKVIAGSVKPASRSPLHFKRQANQAFAWLAWLTHGLERAGQ